MTIRPCIEHGCPQYAAAGDARCVAHRRQRARARWDEGLTGARGSRPGWRRRRARVIARQHGCCAHCRRRGALEVHHRDGNARHDQLSNLVALCHDCHLKEAS